MDPTVPALAVQTGGIRPKRYWTEREMNGPYIRTGARSRSRALAALCVLAMASEPASAFFCMSFGSNHGSRNRHALPPILPPPVFAYQPAWLYAPPPPLEPIQSAVPEPAERKPEPFPESVWPPQTHIQSEER